VELCAVEHNVVKHYAVKLNFAEVCSVEHSVVENNFVELFVVEPCAVNCPTRATRTRRRTAAAKNFMVGLDAIQQYIKLDK
jgi:hypothetical protein